MPKRARVPVNKKGDRNLTYPSQHPIHLPLYKKRGVGGTIRIQPGILKKMPLPAIFILKSTSVFNCLQRKFPTQLNREFSEALQ